MTKLLIVDDDVMTTEFMLVFLQSEGHDVMVSNSAGEALAKLSDAAEPYAAIITDLTLPDGSGVEIAEVAAKMKIPSIAITGYGKSHLSPEHAALFAHVLVKPVDLDLLKEKLSTLLRES